MEKIIDKLIGGDLRSKGRSEEVVKDIEKNKSLLTEIIEAVFNENPLIRMRSADVLEKYSIRNIKNIQKFKLRLIKASKIEQQEVRWHLAQIYSRLEFNQKEMKKIEKILLDWIKKDKSNIVKTCSMQTLADFAIKDKKRKSKIINLIKRMMIRGSPAVVSRGRKLLVLLKN